MTDDPVRCSTYSLDDFEYMRRVGRLTADCLDKLEDIVVPGIPTRKIDEFVYDFAISHKAAPASLGYRGYTKSCCTSINHVVCHGIPGEKLLRDGDIVNIDVALLLDGWHGDASRMYSVGDISPFAKRLIAVTYEAMMKGIEAVKPGNTTEDIGRAIEGFATSRHCSVVRDFCGHGTGLVFHEEPSILHYSRGYRTQTDIADAIEHGVVTLLEPGMIFTIEPMINLGHYAVRTLADGWTAVTRDRSLSAQFEHTVGVTSDGVEIFTLSSKDAD